MGPQLSTENPQKLADKPSSPEAGPIKCGPRKNVSTLGHFVRAVWPDQQSALRSVESSVWSIIPMHAQAEEAEGTGIARFLRLRFCTAGRKSRRFESHRGNGSDHYVVPP